MVNISQISTFKKSSHSEIKNKLLNEFDDVIHDFLNPVSMKSPPMHIHLKIARRNRCTFQPHGKFKNI